MSAAGAPPRRGRPLWQATGLPRPACQGACASLQSHCSSRRMTRACRSSGDPPPAPPPPNNAPPPSLIAPRLSDTVVAHSKLQRQHRRQRKAHAASRSLHKYLTQEHLYLYLMWGYPPVTPLLAGGGEQQSRVRPSDRNIFTGALATFCRTPFSAVQQLESVGKSAIALATTAVTKMKANCTDAPYVFEKGPGALVESGSNPCCGVHANLCARA